MALGRMATGLAEVGFNVFTDVSAIVDREAQRKHTPAIIAALGGTMMALDGVMRVGEGIAVLAQSLPYQTHNRTVC